MDEARFYRNIAELLRKGESLALVTVFDRVGSAPRSNGAKMVVRTDRSITGSVGGGRLEADAIRLALEALSTKRTVVHSFDLSSTDVAGTDMICGGKGEVLIDYVDALDKNNGVVYEAAAETLERGEKAWLVTVLDNSAAQGGPARQQCLVKPNKTLVGSISCDPYLLEKLLAGPAKISIHAEAVGTQRFLVEPLRQLGTVYIFGAGHVSQQIAPLCVSVGFRAVVLDDRADYANRERFAPPTELVVLQSFKHLPDLPIDENSYLVIITRGHMFDKTVLEQVLRSNAAYIGMIGSRSKRDQVFADLISQGYGEEELLRVFAPIGTDIGAETPEELAISIVGELIKVRAKRERNGCTDGGHAGSAQ